MIKNKSSYWLSKSTIIFMLISFTGINYTKAEIELPSIFSKNMVLQQKSTVPLWGKAKAGSTVKVVTSWDRKKYTSNSKKDGTWKILIETPSAGGPYEITFSDGKSLTLKNILIGEVWICSGQSNMEMPVKGFKNQPVLNSSQILCDADNPQIRLIKYERAKSKVPEYDGKSTTWQISDACSVREFSAVGYQFAQLLQRKLNVPVGIIMTSWGGTKIEAWMNQNSLKSFPGISVTEATQVNKNDPAVLFNAMVNPFVGYGIKGMIWYQGEQNRSNAQVYDQLMTAMVKEWRTLWKIGDFPFYYVQIAPFRYNDALGPANLLREAQVKASTQIPNSGMVVTVDIGAENYIHPPDKTTISRRLANWALANDYGFKCLPYANPVYKSMSIDGNVANISFDHAKNGLSSFGKTLSAFEIAGIDRVFYPADAKITSSGVQVVSERVKSPVAVRYAFKDWVVGEIFNLEGFPVSPFRTDDW